METKDQPPVSEEPLADEASDESAVSQDEEVTAEEEAPPIEIPADIEALTPEELKIQLVEHREQVQGYIDQLQRLNADFINYRRRMAQEKLQASDRGKSDLLSALFPVLGNVRLALQHADQDPNSVRQGVQMIWQQCEEFLRQQGVEPVATVGEVFDPAKHEALSMAPATEDTPANTVVAEINAGYMLNGQLLRPAQVVVAQAQAPEPEPAAEESVSAADAED